MPDETNKSPATNLTKKQTHDQISTNTTEVQAWPEFENIVPPSPSQQNTGGGESEGLEDPHAMQEPSPKPDPGSEDAPLAVNPRVAELKFGTGVEGEVNIWEARYSYKNFIGRITILVVLSVSWLVLALFVFAEKAFGSQAKTGTLVLGGILLLLWLWLGWRIIRTRYGRYYRLTNRRLFISNGLFYRERDQVELLTVNDVHTILPTIFHRWFDFGDVIVSSREDKTSTSYIIGINHPKDVQDLVWHYARSERERRAVQIDKV